MNEYDTELIRAILTKKDYALVNDEADADIIMLNTCAIREHAHRKVYGRVHEIHHKRNGRPVKIGILGCMATNLRKELFENRKLKIDFIAGPDSYKHLPDLIEESYELLEAIDLQDDNLMIEELGDVFEVITTIAHTEGFELQDIINIAEKKRNQRGGFMEKAYVDFVELRSDNPIIEYYQANPAKYPEIDKND